MINIRSIVIGLLASVALCATAHTTHAPQHKTQDQTPDAQHPAAFTLGADIGWATEYESKGHKFYGFDGQEMECTALMKSMGMSAIRIRVWVDPEGAGYGRWCGREDVLEKALRAKRLGMDVMIDFHYSDWWADPAKQNIPHAWRGHSYKKMLRDLADHTKDILTMLKDNGVMPRWVQVGNETSNGMLWSVEMDPVTGWERKDANGNTIITETMGHIQRDPKQYAGFFKAGYDAVKEVCPDAQVIVHLDNGWDKDLYDHNLGILAENGARWDIIGMSLYPYWSMQAGQEPSAEKTIIDCIRNIKSVAKKWGTDVIVTETGYEVDEQQPWKMQMGREQLRMLLTRCMNDTEGHCLGVFYWEPECQPSQYKLGAFTSDGRPTDIMRAFRDLLVHSSKCIVHSDQESNSHSSLSTLHSSLFTSYDRKQVVISTTEGDIVVELYNETPQHRDNFLRLVSEHALDSMLFHRVIEGFMIQSGDPQSKNAPATSLNNPAPMLGNDDVPRPDGAKDMPAEILYPQFFHKRGALAAAREGDEDNPEKLSAASEFYIVWGKSPATSGRRPYVPMLDYYKQPSCPGTPWLDGGYTVFGETVSGFDVIERIQQAATDPNDRPLKDIRIIKTTIRE